jgi:hypothetical protein
MYARTQQHCGNGNIFEIHQATARQLVEREQGSINSTHGLTFFVRFKCGGGFHFEYELNRHQAGLGQRKVSTPATRHGKNCRCIDPTQGDFQGAVTTGTHVTAEDSASVVGLTGVVEGIIQIYKAVGTRCKLCVNNGGDTNGL